MTMSIATTDTTNLSALLARAAERAVATLAERQEKSSSDRILAATSAAAAAVAAWGDDVPPRVADATRALADLATAEPHAESCCSCCLAMRLGLPDDAAACAEGRASVIQSVYGDPVAMRDWASLPVLQRVSLHGWTGNTSVYGPPLSNCHPLTRAAYAEAAEHAAGITSTARAARDAAKAREEQDDAAQAEADKVSSARRHATLTRAVEVLGDEVMRAGWAEGVVDRASAVALLWDQIFGEAETGHTLHAWKDELVAVIGEEETVGDVKRVSVDAYRALRVLRDGLAASLASPTLAAVGTDPEPLYELERVKHDPGYRDATSCYSVLATIEIDGVVLIARARLT